MRRTLLNPVVLALCFIAQSVYAGFPDGYYDIANGKNKSSLKDALHKIIKDADVLDYGRGEGRTWSGFYVIDRTSDNYCVDRYSSNKRQFSEANAAPDSMNIEHSFAKSWWEGGESKQAYFDLFNLMPSDSEANSKKSNYAMGEVTRETWTNGSIKIGKGNNVSNKIWEPEDKWKGDFARSYMYMVTCYSDYTWRSNGLDQLENNQWPTFNAWTQKMLMEWSREDPVDEIEIARNQAIYEIQGNRNPYVDFPNLCEYVWGDSMEYEFDINSTVIAIPAQSVVLLDEPMTEGLGTFIDVKADGTEGAIWYSDDVFGAVANAYSLGKVADNYLLAEIDLTRTKSATLVFEHQTGYNVDVEVKDAYFHVLATESYTGTPNTTAWVSLNAEFPTPPSSGWTKTAGSGIINLDAFAGKRIVLAFRYIANTNACYGWEIRNVKIEGMSVPTGIDGVVSSAPCVRCAKAYDLAGRPINASCTKGIFVQDGNIYIR